MHSNAHVLGSLIADKGYLEEWMHSSEVYKVINSVKNKSTLDRERQKDFRTKSSKHESFLLTESEIIVVIVTEFQDHHAVFKKNAIWIPSG